MEVVKSWRDERTDGTATVYVMLVYTSGVNGTVLNVTCKADDILIYIGGDSI